MAQAVHIVMTDDLDDEEMASDDATTVQWSWRGAVYEFDTRTSTVAAIEDGERSVTIGELLSVSRDVTPALHTRRRRAVAGDAATIRSWARRHGHPVPSRGRVPARVRLAYELANGLTDQRNPMGFRPAPTAGVGSPPRPRAMSSA
ncbi:Lsr2 dimerization domain-containing protein [Williamsia sp. SKLECPSW1]